MHNHLSNNPPSELNRAFIIGIAINIVFIIVEVIYGFVSNSMALVSDAGHNLSDVMALFFSWFAVLLSRRSPTKNFTYGYRRSTILVSLLNTVLLIVAVVFIIWEAIKHLGAAEEIKSGIVIIVASAGIIVNGFTAWLFMKNRKNDLNIRSAYVHFFADALVSFGVVLAGIIIAITGWLWVDAVVSFIIIAVILYSTVKLLIASVRLGLDAVPENISIKEVRTYLENLPEVTGIHDLHIWALSTTEAALTVHLSTNTITDTGFVIDVQKELHERFNIEHATIQVEYGDIKNICTNCQ